jgi:hypothetical protein
LDKLELQQFRRSPSKVKAGPAMDMNSLLSSFFGEFAGKALQRQVSQKCI